MKELYATGLDVLAGDDAEPARPAAPLMRVSPPWWHHGAIALGALASLATLVMAFMALSQNNFRTPQQAMMRRGR